MMVASHGNSDSYQYDRFDYRRTPLHQDHVHYSNESRITFLYIIGVEGSGHHLLRPLLQHLAWITGHRPLYGSTTPFHNELWFNRYLNQSQELRNFFIDKVLHPKEHVAVIEFASFPFENNCRSCTPGGIKLDEHYDLEWLYNALLPLKRENMVEIKFMVLNRDWIRTVTSHWPTLQTTDGGLYQHAKYQSNFLNHIVNEFRRVEHTEVKMKTKNSLSHTWIQVMYEWFSCKSQHFCRDLMTNLFEYLNWKVTDHHIETSCSDLMKIFSNNGSHAHPIAKVDYDEIMKIKSEYPIPFLLVSDNGREGR